jgi:hypothetical protein
MTIKSYLTDFDFGNEAGEDEAPEVLNNYFVQIESITNFLSQKHRLFVATAKKGVGKSALLNWSSYNITKEKPSSLVIRCTGADLTREQFGLTNPLINSNDHIKDWMIRICTFVNRRLAEKINIGITDDKITLIESAEIDGFKSRNLIGCFVDRFKKFLGDNQPEKLKASNEIELLKRIGIEQVWLFVDDLDATFQNTQEEKRSLSTFFSACRYLIKDVKGICIRATLRADVWSFIRREDEAMDKMEQYVHPIRWERNEFRSLLYRRISSYMEEHKIQPDEPLTKYRIDEVEEYYIRRLFAPRMFWGNEQKQTYGIIYTLAYKRPRWAVQLCKLAQSAALAAGHTHIEKQHIDSVWGEYGIKRIHDLTVEHKHQCAEIEELIYAFKNAPRRLEKNTLCEWINRHILQHMQTTIEGVPIRTSLEIAQFLFRIGFIVARYQSEEEEEGYEHFDFDKMPSLLNTRTSTEKGVLWEIHPCFREALNIQKVSYEERTHRHQHY